ncbi:FUSC family protein [Actinocorallia libanotica]|uniref:FUSC family protein n=2 Tax=Actinocorallia libanotica TaxID=46162 RepID=A0ABN1QAK7_9ACTN
MFRWGRGAGSQAWRRMEAQWWQVLQSALAASVAWVIALRVAGHPQPFFAPISAVVALSSARGERGTTAVRLVLGVVVGILVADLVLIVLGSTLWTLPLSVFLAMMTATALHSARVMMVQSASSAVLTLVFASSAAGWQRLVDALIGAGVALLVVQLFFPPDPVRLLLRSVKAALTDLAAGLETAARALDDDDEDAARQAQERLWEENDQLAALAQARLFSRRIAQRVPLRRSLRQRVSSEGESARLLNLLNASCVLLIRAALALAEQDRERFAPVLRDLGEAIGGLADDPADEEVRRTAADRALDAVRPFGEIAPTSDPFFATAVMAARMVTMDLLMFTGSDPGGALAAVRTGKDDPGVPPPPPFT